MATNPETKKNFETTLTDVKITAFKSRMGSVTSPSTIVTCVVLPEDIAEKMREYGWSVKKHPYGSVLYVDPPLDSQAVKPFTLDGHPMGRTFFINPGEVLTCNVHISGFYWSVLNGKLSGVKNYVTALDVKTS